MNGQVLDFEGPDGRGQLGNHSENVGGGEPPHLSERFPVDRGRHHPNKSQDFLTDVKVRSDVRSHFGLSFVQWQA